MGFLKLIVWFFFVCVELSWVGPHGPRSGGSKGGSKGGGPTQIKWGPEGWGPKSRGPKGGKAKNFAFFSSHSRRKIRSFLPSLGVLSWNFGGV